jgi:hypothetical protein
VLEEWIVVAGQPIPLGRGDGGDALDNLEVDDTSLANERRPGRHSALGVRGARRRGG